MHGTALHACMSSCARKSASRRSFRCTSGSWSTDRDPQLAIWRPQLECAKSVLWPLFMHAAQLRKPCLPLHQLKNLQASLLALAMALLANSFDQYGPVLN